MQTKVLKMTSLFFLVISIMFSVGCSSHRGNDNIPTDGTKLTITIQEQQFSATLIGNQTTESFIEMLPLTLNMSDLNENEKDSIKRYSQGEALFVCGNRRMRINIAVTKEELDSFGSGGGL